MNQDSNVRRRLELARMMREENKSNRIRIHARENILYGKPLSGSESFEEYNILSDTGLPTEKETVQLSTFGLRLTLSVILFAVYFICKTQNISFAGITSEQVEMAVSGEADILQSLPASKIIDFIDQFTYTLHDS